MLCNDSRLQTSTYSLYELIPQPLFHNFGIENLGPLMWKPRERNITEVCRIQTRNPREHVTVHES